MLTKKQNFFLSKPTSLKSFSKQGVLNFEFTENEFEILLKIGFITEFEIYICEGCYRSLKVDNLEDTDEEDSECIYCGYTGSPYPKKQYKFVR